jgi:hypothetical protein
MKFYSVHFNRPDFIEIQKNCIETIGGSLIVIDNSLTGSSIKNECSRLDVTYIEVPDRLAADGSPSRSHGRALNYLKSSIDYTDDWCLLDHDFFPTKKIEFDNYDIIAIPEIRRNVTYLWPGYIAGKSVISLDGIDFLPDSQGYGDTGFGTRVLAENTEYRIKYISQCPIDDIPEDRQIQTFPTLMEVGGYGIHYLNGSSWMNTLPDIINEKNEYLINILESRK